MFFKHILDKNMFLNNFILFGSLALIINLQGASSDFRPGICTKRVISENRYTSYVETYNEMTPVRKYWCISNCYINKSVMKTRRTGRIIPIWKTVESCCEGFKVVTTETWNSRLACEPVCQKLCVNGQCTAPNTCSCQAGYRSVENQPSYGDEFYDECKPICSKECINGRCSKPDVCVCDLGYVQNETDLSVCDPECDSCENGKCIEPLICHCNEGFMREDETCKPACPLGCEQGNCVSPGVCQCVDGFELNGGKCLPECSNGCTNGTCIAPNECQCEDGFRVEGGTCVPFCSQGCVNGTCEKPNVCQCEDGFVFANGICIPFCSKECGNGTCIAPDTCKCFEGYKLEDGTCYPFCSTGCVNGICVEPEVCKCDDGYALSAGTCKPICSDTCESGACVAPGVCQELEETTEIQDESTEINSMDNVTFIHEQLSSLQRELEKTTEIEIRDESTEIYSMDNVTFTDKQLSSSWSNGATYSIVATLMILIVIGAVITTFKIYRRRKFNMDSKTRIGIHILEPSEAGEEETFTVTNTTEYL